MTDAWSDRKRRSIMNLCVNCKLGTTFLSSIKSSADAHTGKYIFDYVDKWIEEVGSKNVIQVVTDNASNNMAAAKLLNEKRPYIFWTSCATHTMNLILEGIGKMPKFKFVIDKSKELTIFIYAHHKTLSLMRKFTKKRDIVRPGITRFASSFLTMQSLLEKQENLRYMFLSKEWLECKWSSTAKGTKIYSTIVSQTYWQALSMCVEIFKPLVKVLRLVDGDWRPSMGFVYGELKDAKKEIIRICRGAADMYEPILDIIESKAKGRLDCPLHLAGYLLNPYFFYRDDEAQTDPKCMEGLLTCVESFFPDDYDKQNLIHTKKRNRLDANRMRDLVYVQFNSKLLNKKKKREAHDILLADDASMAQAWIVEVDEEDVESQGSTSIADDIYRDLDEDNFESDDEEVVENNKLLAQQ
ncbi:uncharacterized protein LOC108225831 [Daucus carota subsp. sativus]|uniref:uncharacterized protein LOC108225831 n=1 Tax=Daucus carota subsp. sativus TaxID=79200 RepID=UPI003083489A